jgi:hypothetical protein
LSTAATAAAAAVATTVVELTIVHCQRKWQQRHHHQRINGSTNMKTFTSPVDLDLFNLYLLVPVLEKSQFRKYFGKWHQFREMFVHTQKYV